MIADSPKNDSFSTVYTMFVQIVYNHFYVIIFGHIWLSFLGVTEKFNIVNKMLILNKIVTYILLLDRTPYYKNIKLSLSTRVDGNLP